MTRESNGPASASGITQVYLDKAANKRNCRSFVTGLVLAVLLNLSAELRWNLIYNGHALVTFQPADYEEDYSTVQGIDKLEYSSNATIN